MLDPLAKELISDKSEVVNVRVTHVLASPQTSKATEALQASGSGLVSVSATDAVAQGTVKRPAVSPRGHAPEPARTPSPVVHVHPRVAQKIEYLKRLRDWHRVETSAQEAMLTREGEKNGLFPA